MNGSSIGKVAISASKDSQYKRRLWELAHAHLSIPIDAEQQTDREQRLQPLLNSLSGNVFRLVIMGEVKKGKSSFINALLGQPKLLPTDIDVSTSTVFKIVNGAEERITVFFSADEEEAGDRAKTVDIHREQLTDYGTEVGNPANEKNVDFIAIELPHPLLAEGIAIVDTPGVGGLFKRHRDVTLRYAPQADVVMFVIDSAESIITDDEKQFIKELLRNTQRIVFLQTKIDIAGTEQVQSWKKRNLDILAELMDRAPDSIPYFLVGASLKQLADRRSSTELLHESGYLQVLKYLKEDLIPNREAILVRRWMPVLAQELVNSARQVSDRLAIVRQSHQPQIAEYERKLIEAEREFDRWHTEVWPVQYRQFQDAVTHLKLDTKNRLHDGLSPASRDCIASLRELRASCNSAHDVEERCDEYIRYWATRWVECVATALTDFRQEYLRYGEALLGQLAESLARIPVPEIQLEVAERRDSSDNSLLAVRDAAMTYNVFGGMAGEAAKWIGMGAGVAVGLGIIATPIGWTVGAAAGVGYVATKVWAAVRGYHWAHERQRDAAIGSVEHAMQRTGAEALKSAIRAFEKLSAELDSAGRSHVDEVRLKMKNDFTTRKQELILGKTRSVSDSRAAEEVLKVSVGRYQELLKQFQMLKQELDAGEGGGAAS